MEKMKNQVFDIHDHKEVVSYLSNGLSPNTKIGRFTPIDLAFQKHAEETTGALLNHPDFDKEGPSYCGYTPLLSAVAAEELKIAGELVEKGCNVFAQTEQGYNIVDIILSHCSPETPDIEGFVTRLTGIGAGWLLDLPSTNEYVSPSFSPLMLGMRRGHRKLCRGLLVGAIGVDVIAGLVLEYSLVFS
jgi:hypothetical protein